MNQNPESRSKASIRREQQRLSPKTAEFKLKVIRLLETAEAEISYAIKRDLAIMTNMPFYGDRPEVIKITGTPIEIIHEYAKLFCKCDDKPFIVSLMKKLGMNQGQMFRKAAPKIGEKKDIWEHAIPTKFIIGETIKMVLSDDISDLRRLLIVYENAGQRGLGREQESLLRNYWNCMPEGWDWRDQNVDPLARYKAVGILV